MEEPAVPVAEDLTWEIDVPLLNNRLVVGAIVRAFGIAAFIMGALLTLVFAIQGDWDSIPQVWVAAVLVGAGLIVLGLMIMALAFRNRMRFRFTVDGEGVLFETVDRTARAANRAAVVAGVLAGSPQALGAGLIARSQESQRVEWRGSFLADYEPRRRTVVFRNRWRRLMIVYCTPENYADVAERVRAGMECSGSADRVPSTSPLPRYLAYTALVIVASIPVFMLGDAFNVPLLIPLLLLCFALATVWLVGLFGYVVLAGIALVVGAVVVDALSVHESFFRAGETYARWTVYSGDDWALLVIAGVGLALLAWFAIQALSGRIPSMLASDAADMGE